MSTEYTFQESQNRAKLEVSYDAGEKEIKDAYIKLVKKYNPENPDGDLKKFTEINNAYKNLIKEIHTSQKKINKNNNLSNSTTNLLNKRKTNNNGNCCCIIIVFLFVTILLLIAILFLIFMWNIHPILGLFGLAVFLWMLNNKWKSGYFF